MTKTIDRSFAQYLLKTTKEPRDKLPYSGEFDRLHKTYCKEKGKVGKYELMQEFFNLAKKGGYSGRRSDRVAPDLTIAQAVFIGRRLGGRLSARGSLV